MKYIHNVTNFIQGLLIGMKLMGAGMSWWIVFSPTIITLLLISFLVAMIANWDDEQT